MKRTVKFLANQGAEDLYCCVDEGKQNRMYVRQPCDKEHVRWLTGSKWSGGYEADCPLKDGLEICVVAKDGNELFTEFVTHADGYDGTVSQKKGQFSYEAVRNLAVALRKTMKLCDFSEWKTWLMRQKLESSRLHESFSADEWLWINNRIMRSEFSGKGTFVTGQEYIILHTWHQHTVSNVSWEEIKICSADQSYVFEICGYRWSGFSI